MRQKGEITVFLSLVLVILVSVLFTVIEAANINAVQFQTECVADMALQSALAEYNRELLEQYDLFFIDTGYGTEETGYCLLEEHIRDYMQENFEIEEGIFSSGVKDLLGLSAESAAVLECAGAVDADGEVLERKAVDYMLDLYGLLDLSEMKNDRDTVTREDLLGDSMEKKRRENEEDIDNVDIYIKDDDGKKKKIPIGNPADHVNRKRGSMRILKLVTDGDNVSEKEIEQKDYISCREKSEKDGFLLGEKGVTGADDLIFQKYLMEKCGKYTDKKEGSLLDYEMEYILAGKNSDQENLRAVVNKLLVLRETANFMYLMGDSGKQAEAEALAMTLAAVLLFPELKDLIKLSILIAWAYAESVNDVKILLHDGNVPLWKDAESWRLSVKNAMKLKLDEAAEGSAEGLSYEAYLHVLLAVMDKKERNMRFMDIVEMDIRQTPGNQNFRIDQCVHAFTAELAVNSAGGHGCQITRTVGYLK